jgi:uncharacterized membrane protein
MTEPDYAQDPAVIEAARRAKKMRVDVRITHAIYGLQAAGVFIFFPLLIAVVVSYFNQDTVYGTWLESHYRWQIRTFWWFILGSIIAIALKIVLIGFFIAGFLWLWLIYRIAKGWRYLMLEEPLRCYDR